MKNPTTPAPDGAHSAGTDVYTPGYAVMKLLMIGLGLVMFLLGLTQVWTPLRLLAFGTRAVAEASTVIKAKPGIPDTVFTDDLQIEAGLESRDRSWVFWNEFRFHTADGRVVEVRAPVGSQLKPLYPLLNVDGLPTTDVIYYDPAWPQVAVFPLIISTWFAAGALLVSGLAAIGIGAVLFHWSKKPITLPHMPGTPHAGPNALHP